MPNALWAPDMDNYDIKLLSPDDGSWQAFQDDWKSQCAEVGEEIDDFAPDILKLIGDIVEGTAPRSMA